MATSIVIACPECDKQIKVSEDLIGKKIRCKECGEAFPVRRPKGQPAAKAPPPKAKEPVKPAMVPNDDPDDGENPYALAKDADEGIARCPNCVKPLESSDARVCLHCGYNLTTRTRAEVKAVYEATGEEKFKWLLPGILCTVAIVILVVTSIIIMVKTKGMMEGSFLQDEDDKSKFMVKPGCFMLANGMAVAFVCYHLGRFAYKRLVVNNKPPERIIQKDDDEEGDEDD